ncbi:rod shape-determining protein MreD [Calidifontibacillus oryziterrae]|uniref:rod shape-determining protein MreD n=1 Tax=Calidifontibacillus oryziterrae TaxID=1191699 RepID=UPI0003152493|nr:rod shape-determining protein MreD [Calidifontibacillus oryziterrae]
MWRKFLLPFLLFLAFISESIFVEFVPIEAFNIERIFVPRFVMIMLMLLSFFYERNLTVLYGVIFGLMFDIVYTDIIGVYMFSFAIVVYVISYSMKVLHRNILVILLVSLVGLCFFESLVYGLYKLINIANLEWTAFVNNRLFPTLVLNGFFLIIIYYPMRKLLIKLEQLASKESSKLL